MLAGVGAVGATAADGAATAEPFELARGDEGAADVEAAGAVAAAEAALR